MAPVVATYEPRDPSRTVLYNVIAEHLETFLASLDDVARHTLALSTYLGHTHVTDTYWYLQATPRLMRHIADACAAYEGGEAP